MSNTLTKQVKARLAEFTDRITSPVADTPAAPAPTLTAADLRARGITTDRKGQPIKAGQLYFAAAPPAVNHHRRLQTAYVAGGWPRVQAYLQPFLTPEGYARQQAAAAAGGAAAASALATAGDFAPLPPIDEQQPGELRISEPAGSLADVASECEPCRGECGICEQAA